MTLSLGGAQRWSSTYTVKQQQQELELELELELGLDFLGKNPVGQLKVKLEMTLSVPPSSLIIQLFLRARLGLITDCLLELNGRLLRKN